MGQPDSIVVGTDGSQTAERAVERAGEIASALGAKVHVVSGFNPGSNGVWMAAAGRLAASEVNDADEARTRAEHYVDRAQRHLAKLGVASESHVWPGDPADALVKVADEQGAQMIVVGNRGMTGARRVLGSVPNSVSHHAHCGVLIVPTS